MEYISKKLDGGEMELTITVVPADYQKNLENAATRLSERAGIKGFRPGKAPYDTVKQQLGEHSILEEAMESIVQKNFFDAVEKEKLATIGMPLITVEKMAPGNDIVFKAKVALLPTVELPDLKTIKVTAKKPKVADKEVDDTLQGLRKMQTKEIIKNGTATKDDKIIIDLEMFLDKVPVDGGQAKDHQVYLSEEHYIPGLSEQLIGLKKNDAKEFTLTFPQEHYQKHLAGKLVDFKIKAREVYSLELPALDDNFAASLGQKDLAGLKELIRKNMEKEAEMKESQRLEADILEQLVAKTKFSALPEVLTKNEKQKMFHELKHDLEHRGLNIDDYLKQIKKTEDEIFKDFAEGADKRVKASLVSRQIAVDKDIKVTKEEMEKEIELIKQAYPGNTQVTENLTRPEVLDTINTTIQNRKVVEYLKKEVIKSP